MKSHLRQSLLALLFALILCAPVFLFAVATTLYKTTGATVVTQSDCTEQTFSPDSGKKFISGFIYNAGTANNLLVKYSSTSNSAFPIIPGGHVSWGNGDGFVASSVITYCGGSNTTSYIIVALQASGQ